MQRVEVPVESAGSRLDRFLASLDAVGSRAAAERLIESGEVRVGDRARPKSHRLAAGDVVSFPSPQPAVSPLRPHDLAIPVLHRDSHLLVVDKPAGLLVHPVPGFSGPTLVHGLLHELEGDGARPGHRPPARPRHLRAAGGGA